MKLSNDGAYYTWVKGEYENLGRFFTTKEMECCCTHPRCTEQRIAVELIRRLDATRAAHGKPIRINDGYRCPMEQEDLRRRGFETAKGISQHELGRAADISCANMAALMPLLEQRFKAIGAAHSWAHVDLRDDKVRRWTYK